MGCKGLYIAVVFILALGATVLANILKVKVNKRQTSETPEYMTARQFLRFYNYLQDTEDPMSNEPANPAQFSEAMKIFQKFNGLTVTGTETEEATALMRRERCGCPDVFDMRKNMSAETPRVKRLANFQPQEFRVFRGWRRTDLTWRFVSERNFPRNLNPVDVRSEIERAFRVWSDVTPLSFTESGGRADIEIDFVARSHGDGSPFDGPSRRGGSVLAHAFFPENGRSHFDLEETWFINETTSGGVDLFTVAAHEFGHALGLQHSENSQALMAPFYKFVRNFQLHPDDRAGIQLLYGSPRVTRRTTPTTTTTRRPTTTPTTPRPSNIPACVTMPIKGAIRDDNGDVLLFTRNRFYVPPYVERRNGQFVNTLERLGYRSKFPFSPYNADAVFQTPNNTIFLRRRLIFQYARARNLIDRNLVGLNFGLRGVSERITAAVALSQNTVYLLGSQNAWRFNYQETEVVPNSQLPLQSLFPDMTFPVDAAYSESSRVIIFIKDSNAFRYDVVRRTLIDGPLNLASYVFGGPCSEN